MYIFLRKCKHYLKSRKRKENFILGWWWKGTGSVKEWKQEELKKKRNVKLQRFSFSSYSAHSRKWTYVRMILHSQQPAKMCTWKFELTNFMFWIENFPLRIFVSCASSTKSIQTWKFSPEYEKLFGWNESRKIFSLVPKKISRNVSWSSFCYKLFAKVLRSTLDMPEK